MNALLFWLLQRMAANPKTIFWERELRDRFPEAFVEAQQLKLIRRATAAGEGDLFTYFLGRVLTIAEDDAGFVGIDEDDLDELPIPLSDADLQRAYLDLDVFALWLKRAHGFEGNPERVHDRLYQLGEVRHGLDRTALLLGLVQPTLQSMDTLTALPAFLSNGYQHYLVHCPVMGFTPEQVRLLRGSGILLLPMSPDLDLDYRSALAPPPRLRPSPSPLSPEEEQEAEARGLLTSVTIHLTGERKGHRNIVLVSGLEVPITATPFRQFLRLVIALAEGDEGWVPLEELAQLANDSANAPQGLEQLTGRMREPFTAALNGLPGTTFIERDENRLRLAVYPRLITWDRPALLKHPDGPVRLLAARLPRSA